MADRIENVPRLPRVQGREGLPATLGVSLAAWLLVCLIDSTWYTITALQKGAPPPWTSVFMHNLPYWLAAVVLTPPVVWLTRRFPFGAGPLWRPIAVHGLGVFGFALLHVGLFRFVDLLRNGWRAVEIKLFYVVQTSLSTTLDREILFYVVIAGTVTAFDYRRRFREKERAAAALELEQARLRASLSEARLGALTMQLQPHFLFNVLHAIQTLILKGETRAANQMLLHLSSFLRMTLASGESPIVHLSVELEFLDAYLRIQRVRFGERLAVRLEIDEGVRDGLVPNLILQPLVENAIRHGIGADPGGGSIVVRARTEGQMLRLEVQDDGPGPSEESASNAGVGLSNIRARLDQLYPGEHHFALERCPAGGAKAVILIPFRRDRNRG